MSGAVLWSAMAGGIRAVARMSLRAPRQHGGNVVIAHARPSLRAVASFPQARGGVVAVAGSADAPGTAVRAAAAVGAIARRDAATSSGRIAHLAAGIAPRFRSLRCTAPARTALNASSGDDERVNLDLDDDPFEHVATPLDEAAFDAAVDDIIADDDDVDAPAGSTSSAWSYSAPGDDLPWDANGAWPEFDALLGKLMAKGYRIEPEGAAGGPAVDASVSTPEWARAVAKSYDRESNGESDGEDDELSDPFAHVAKQKGEWDTDDSSDDDLVELSYANKKRLLLEFSRDREDLLRRLSERELYVLADHPLRKDQGNAGGRKVVNAMKRLRARLGVDASYFAGQCAALGGGDTMGECTFSDVTRLVHVFADDVAPQFRPDRAAMQSLIDRKSVV